MVKIFQGEHKQVESDVNNWIEVFNPRILDIKQSTVLMHEQHSVVLILTVLYEGKSGSQKVEYKIHDTSSP